MNKMLSSDVRTVGVAAIIMALSYEAIAQEKRPTPPTPPEKWAACSSLKKEAACKAGKNCSWVVEKKDEKGTVKRNAYCRSNPNGQKDDARQK